MDGTFLIFYVYAYLRDKDSATAKAGTPYYIGKGSNRRAWEKHIGAKRPKELYRIVMLETNLTEIGAFALERRYIKWWGRQDLGTGILLNRTDGGEGSAGLVFPESAKKILSEKNKGKIIPKETREKLSKAGKGRKQTEEHSRNKTESRIRNGYTQHSEETRKKMSDHRQNTPLTDAQKEVLRKMSENNKGKKSWNSGKKTGPRTPEQIENMRKAQQERYKNGKDNITHH